MTSNKQALYITGGSGFVGGEFLRVYGEKWCSQSPHHLIVIQSRDPDGTHKRLMRRFSSTLLGPYLSAQLRVVDGLQVLPADIDIFGFINLAGAGIADARWSASRKKVLFTSRVDTTKTLAEECARSGRRAQVLLQASAVGFYGAQPSGQNQALTEDAIVGSGFAAELCERWEQASQVLAKFCQRSVVLRLGVVLGPGGFLSRVRVPFLLGAGGPLGDGRQPFPWIHVRDLVDVMELCMTNNTLSGQFNVCAPGLISQGEFAKAYGITISRPAIFPAPRWLLMTFLGDMAREILLEGVWAQPKRLLDVGYVFSYPAIEEALLNIEKK